MFPKIALVSVVLIVATEAFLFPGGGGGGCGCGAPPPPPCQPISLPQPCLPQLPQPCLPQLPQFQLPSLPSCGGGGGCGGGCGGRKKREAGSIAADDNAKCTDPELRKIIVKNIGGDIEDARQTIRTAAEAHLSTTNIAVLCSPDRNIDFASTVETFCIDGSDQRTCGVFKLD